MNKNTQSKFSTIANNLKNNHHNSFLNIIISLLIIIIIVMVILLVSKIQNMNELKEIAEKNKVVNKTIQVEVLNGCGILGAADNVTDLLRKMNYDVVQIGNYRTFDIDESIVIDRTGNMKIAKNIADSLGINRANVIQQINKNYLLDASIIVGKDYKHLKLKN